MIRLSLTIMSIYCLISHHGVAHQELIDPEFLQMMENYATGLE